MLNVDDMELLNFGSIGTFLASILYFFATFTQRVDSTLSTVFSSLVIVIVCYGAACYVVAMLPFITDQIIGATSDELSAVVRWYYWAQYAGVGSAYTAIYWFSISSLREIILPLIFAVPLAVIIISDCLCHQWLDRTHKVTNPIKLIILNYTRKHRYPERRSAFTYIDEEQPTRMDYGKEKFGGPFTEEEVEDVKTVLRLIPLVICISFIVGSLGMVPYVDIVKGNMLANKAISNFAFPLVLIPLYQLLLYRCFHRFSTSMLQCIGVGLFICILGYIFLAALGVVGMILSDDVQEYLSCSSPNATDPGDQVEWYWKLVPWILYSSGSAITAVIFLEIIIAQSPDKMKGFVMGIVVFSHGFVFLITVKLMWFTLCLGLSISLSLVILFVVFLVLCKRYTLRERNREINIQAIVEEHYERYMDQEEEYMRQPHY